MMSTLHDFDASDEPPPPAYEFTQQEFDQKISHALEQSRAAVDEEGGEWEVWDEAAFAAAAAALTVSDNSTPAVAGASSSRSPPPPPRPALASSSFPSSHNGDGRSNYSNEEGTATQPLRIVKKSRDPSAKEKERPSWYSDAGLDGHQRSASTSSRQRAPNSLHVANNPSNHSTVPVQIEEDRESTPPPMFEAVGPSLEGPPYEGYGEPQPQQQPGLVMAYAPGDSRPPSPLQSPTTSPTLSQAYVSSPPPLIQPLPGRRTLPVPPSRSPVPAALRREPREQQHLSIPQPPRPSGHRPDLRPTASYRDSSKTKSYVPPRVAFDPRIAYGEKDRSSYYDVPEESPPLDIDPASFYTASVSSIYSASTKRTRTSSIASSSLYSQPTAPQSTYSLPQTHSQYVAQPQAHYPINRESMRSPAPSVHSVASQSSQNHAQSYERQTTYQQTYTAPAPSRTSTYVPTAYQPTAYAPTSYQQQQQQQQQPPQSSGYQQTAYQQQAVSNSYQTNGYLPTAY